MTAFGQLVSPTRTSSSLHWIYGPVLLIRYTRFSTIFSETRVALSKSYPMFTMLTFLLIIISIVHVMFLALSH